MNNGGRPRNGKRAVAVRRRAGDCNQPVGSSAVEPAVHEMVFHGHDDMPGAQKGGTAREGNGHAGDGGNPVVLAPVAVQDVDVLIENESSQPDDIAEIMITGEVPEKMKRRAGDAMLYGSHFEGESLTGGEHNGDACLPKSFGKGKAMSGFADPLSGGVEYQNTQLCRVMFHGEGIRLEVRVVS